MTSRDSPPPVFTLEVQDPPKPKEGCSCCTEEQQLADFRAGIHEPCECICHLGFDCCYLCGSRPKLLHEGMGFFGERLYAAGCSNANCTAVCEPGHSGHETLEEAAEAWRWENQPRVQQLREEIGKLLGTDIMWLADQLVAMVANLEDV